MRKIKAATGALALLLTASSVLGCSSKDNTNEGTLTGAGETAPVGSAAGNANQEVVKFSYLRPTWGPATYAKGGAYEKELFKQANVEIDVQIIPVIDFDAKINTILAGGDLPDVLWANGPLMERDRDLQEQGAFLPINEYLEKYPAVKDAVPDGIWEQLKAKDGNNYFIPNLIYPITPAPIMYRQDWFEKLGIAEPKTVDELVAALEIIKNSDPDNNGKNDTIPLTAGYEWSFKDLATAWEVSFNGWTPDPNDANRIIPSIANEKNIDFYYWLQNLYNQGLLDPEFKLNKEPNFAEDKFNAGMAAVIATPWVSYIEKATKLLKIDPNAKVGIMSPLAGPDGTPGGTRSVFPVDRGFYVSAKAKDPDGIFRFLNWTLTEGSDLRRYGVEGKTYNAVDGKKVVIPNEQREQDYKGEQIEPLRFLDPIGEKLDWDSLQLDYEGAGIGDKFEYVKGKFEEYAKIDYPDWRDYTVASPADAELGARLWNDYMQQVVDSAIINKSSNKQQWLDALKKWSDAGGQKIIDEVNELQTNKNKPDYVN